MRKRSQDYIENPESLPTWTVLMGLYREIKGYRWKLVLVLLVNLAATPLALLNPIPLKIVVDNVLGSEAVPKYVAILLPDVFQITTRSLLVGAAVLMVVIALISQLRKVGASYLKSHTAQYSALAFRTRLFRHAQRLSLAYHDRTGSVDTLYRIQNDASAVRQVFVDAAIPLVEAWFRLIGMIAVTALIDFELTLIALGALPVMLILVRVFGTRLKNKWRDWKGHDSSTMKVVQETMSTLRVVKAFGKEDYEEKRFVDKSNATIRSQLSAVLTQSTYSGLVALTMSTATALVLFVGALHVQSGVLSLGELLMIMAYISQLMAPLYTIGGSATGLANGLASGERALKLLNAVPDIADQPGARPVTRLKGDISFEDVSFGYHQTEPVLSQISFQVKAGQSVGIMGKTGAGKTTLISLLMRFYDPDVGRVVVDGTDIRDYRLADYRDQFGIVLQEPVLFSSTIAENIGYGRDGATRSEIEEAAVQANASEFISRLPEGYDTQVGDRGVMMSGGERQRISLARAFLKNAPILILDEPTSSVDVGTESEIMEVLRRLQAGRTTFVIAHRLSTLQRCDFLLVLDDGRLVNQTSDVASVIGKARALSAETISEDVP